jgi:hypothetical protein
LVTMHLNSASMPPPLNDSYLNGSRSHRWVILDRNRRTRSSIHFRFAAKADASSNLCCLSRSASILKKLYRWRMKLRMARLDF